MSLPFPTSLLNLGKEWKGNGCYGKEEGRKGKRHGREEEGKGEKEKGREEGEGDRRMGKCRERKDRERGGMEKKRGRGGKENLGAGSGVKPRKTAENRDFYSIFIFGSSCTHALTCPRCRMINALGRHVQ